MLDLNRHYPPKYYIGDVYLDYLAEKKTTTTKDPPNDYSSLEWVKAFQSKASDISKPASVWRKLLHVLRYDL